MLESGGLTAKTFAAIGQQKWNKTLQMFTYMILGDGFKYLFSPLIWGRFSNLTNILQMGWFNHQLGYDLACSGDLRFGLVGYGRICPVHIPSLRWILGNFSSQLTGREVPGSAWMPSTRFFWGQVE